jgi:hypothetical protein
MHGLRRSMGETGIWDNADTESLWSTFKREYYYRHAFRTKTELVAAVDNWIQFYSNRSRHSAIGILAPITYERKLNAATQVTLTPSTFSGGTPPQPSSILSGLLLFGVAHVPGATGQGRVRQGSPQSSGRGVPRKN